MKPTDRSNVPRPQPAVPDWDQLTFSFTEADAIYCARGDRRRLFPHLRARAVEW